MTYEEFFNNGEYGTVWLFTDLISAMHGDLAWCMIRVDYSEDGLFITRMGESFKQINNMSKYKFGMNAVYNSEAEMLSAIRDKIDGYISKLEEFKDAIS